MANQFDEIDTDALGDEQDSPTLRWVSTLVICIAVVGFFMLAWYAYHAGMEQTNTAAVDVIKADSTPIKEAPANPGGQQFPHQDKTVYNLVAGKEEPKTAERIMPPPEEPVNRGDTETWMNKKLYPDAAAASTTDTAKPEETAAVEPPAPTPAPAPTPPAEIFKARPPTKSEQAAAATENVKPIKVAAAEPPAPAPTPPPAPVKTEAPTQGAVTKPVETNESEAAAIAEKPAAKPTAPATKGPIAQLGAFKSEAEAKAEWERIKTRNAKIIADKQSNIVRADLGKKGVFYRLQLSDFGGAKEAKSFCSALSANHQACILVSGK